MRLALPLAAMLLASACSPAPSGNDAPGSSLAPSAPASTTTPAGAPAQAPASPVAASGESSIPTRFHGTWAVDAAACAADAHESRLAIDGDSVDFHESQGTVRSLREDGDTLEVVLMLVGEGSSWETTRRFTLAADGASLDDPGNGIKRIRCG